MFPWTRQNLYHIAWLPKHRGLIYHHTSPKWSLLNRFHIDTWLCMANLHIWPSTPSDQCQSTLIFHDLSVPINCENQWPISIESMTVVDRQRQSVTVSDRKLLKVKPLNSLLVSATGNNFMEASSQVSVPKVADYQYRHWLSAHRLWISGWPLVREFDSCQGNVRDLSHFTKNQRNVREKILSWKSCLKLFIISCIFVSIQVFSRSLFCVKY